MRLLFLLMVIILSCSCFDTYAQGELLIFPKRIVFKDNETKNVINLINSGEETTTYSVSFTQRRMEKDGGFTRISVPEEGQLFADSYLRIYPRQVTLLPGEAQSVMIQRRRKSNMQTGEYRSHLYFRSERDNSDISIKRKDSSNTLSIELIPIIGITIPIIFRSGEVSAIAALSDLKIEKLHGEDPRILFILNRKGNSSLYGDLTIEYYPVKGASIIIAKKRGVAIYTTIEKRNMSIKINRLAEINLNEGILKIKYTSPPGDGRQIIFTETELMLTN